MAGEKSVLSGEAGQKITKRLLDLCGWNIAEHIDAPCHDGVKHKSNGSKAPRTNHSFDAIHGYKSPLNHSITNVVAVSAKHHIDKYPESSKTKINRTVKELAQAIECLSVNHNVVEDYGQGRQIEFDGLVTYFSSAPEEKHSSFFKERSDEVSIPTDDFNTIYFIDNRRATFLFSAIREAQAYGSEKEYSFVYPDTGLNIDTESINPSGRLLPLELMCSDILPIAVEKNDDYHVLLFCNDSFEGGYLKRIIWLAHRLCTFATRILIFFPDYDNSQHDSEVKRIKQSFQESNLISRITLEKWDESSFIRLKDDSHEDQNLPITPKQAFPITQLKLEHGKITDDYDKILPFGAAIKPILNSSMLSASDLKEFLKRKGIFVKFADKDLIIPIFAGMMLSPADLDHLKSLLLEKEDKPKSINKSALFQGDVTQAWKAIKTVNVASIELKGNCKHLKSPMFTSTENSYTMNINIERHNTTKDLISGKTQHSGNISITIDNNKIHVKTEFTSPETKSYLEDVVAAVNLKLKENGLINEDLRSIKFSDFPTNKDRVLFLTGFKNLNYSEHFTNGEIINIKFKSDDTLIELPNELDGYRGRVRSLDINGSTLEELPHIYDPKYQDAILLSRVRIKFKFAIKGNTGLCLAEIDFPSTLNGRGVDKDTDLQVSVEVLKNKDNKLTESTTNLQNRLTKIMDQIVLNSFDSKSYSQNTSLDN